MHHPKAISRIAAGTKGAPSISLKAFIWLLDESPASVALFQAAMPKFIAEPIAIPNATL